MALWSRDNSAINQQLNFLHSVTPVFLLFRHFTLWADTAPCTFWYALFSHTNKRYSKE